MVRLEGRIPDRAVSEGLALLVAIGGLAMVLGANSPAAVTALAMGVGILFRGAFAGVKEIKVSRQFERSLRRHERRLADIAAIAQQAKEQVGSPFRGAPTVLESLDAVQQLAEDRQLIKNAGPYLFHECGCPVYPRMAETGDHTSVIPYYPPEKVSE